MDTQLYVTSPYCRARLERLAREAGMSVEKFTAVFFEKIAMRVFSRIKKGNTNPNRAKDFGA